MNLPLNRENMSGAHALDLVVALIPALSARAEAAHATVPCDFIHLRC